MRALVDGFRDQVTTSQVASQTANQVLLEKVTDFAGQLENGHTGSRQVNELQEIKDAIKEGVQVSETILRDLRVENGFLKTEQERSGQLITSLRAQLDHVHNKTTEGSQSYLRRIQDLESQIKAMEQQASERSDNVCLHDENQQNEIDALYLQLENARQENVHALEESRLKDSIHHQQICELNSQFQVLEYESFQRSEISQIQETKYKRDLQGMSNKLEEAFADMEKLNIDVEERLQAAKAEEQRLQSHVEDDSRAQLHEAERRRFTEVTLLEQQLADTIAKAPDVLLLRDIEEANSKLSLLGTKVHMLESTLHGAKLDAQYRVGDHVAYYSQKLTKGRMKATSNYVEKLSILRCHIRGCKLRSKKLTV